MKKAFLKPTNSSKIFLVSLLLIQFHLQPALSATTNIDSSNITTSSIDDNDIVNFIGGGSLIVNSPKTLDSLTTTGTFGNVNFSTANNLSITNSIGTSGKALNNISFSADGILTLEGDVYLNNAITTTTNESGSIILNSSVTASLQKIDSAIGINGYKLKELSINGKGATFNKDVNVINLVNNYTNSEISGSGNLNFINANITDNLKISSSGNVNIGAVGFNGAGNTVNNGKTSIASGISLTINNNSTSLTNLDIVGSGKVIINNNKSLNILGNVDGADSFINTETVKPGDPANIGTLTFSGKTTQTIQASIGENTTKLTNLINLNVSNVLSSEKPSISNGVALENDAYLNNIKFTNIADTSKISIATGKSISLLKNIAESSGGKGIITGAGALNLDGTSIQTIDANLGTSNADRLGELNINNTAKITLNDESYIAKLTSLKSSSLANNSKLNITELDIQDSLKVSGSGDFEVANLKIATSKNLTLENDKTIKITNAITGSGAIKTNSSGTGNILFSSSADINVANKIGESSAYLNKIIVNNDDGIAVNFNNDVFASGINFINSAGQSKIAIANAKTLNISGDVNNLSDSLITGTGNLILSGTNKEQNIYAKIGTDATKISTLQINNPFGTTLYQNSFVDNLTLTNGALKIAGKTLAITNGLDLTNKSFTSKIIDDFGKIKSSTLILDDTTIITFDYSNNNVDLDYATDKSSLVFAPAYSIIETIDTVSAQSISGDINLVKVSDNSYLFDNILEKSDKKIVTKIKVSDNFSEANIGIQDYQDLNNVLSLSNLASKFFRISSKENLNIALTSLKPIPIETTINNALNVNDTTFNAISSHLKNFDLTTAINNSSDKNINNKKPKKIELWGQLFGNKLTLKSNDSKQKFNTNNYGGIIGFDHLIKSKNNDILIGSAIAINKSRIFDDLKIHNNNIDSYQVALYNINYSKINEGFYSKNLANLSLNIHKNLRTLKIENYQEDLKSNFNGKSYSFESGVGYKFKIIDNFSITPDLSLQYFKLAQDSYKEKAKTDSSLVVKGSNYNEFIAKLGINFAGKFTYSELEYQPNFAISWDRKLKNNQQFTQSNFVSGGNSSINSLKILQRDKLNLSFGLNLSNTNNQRLNLKYDLQLANHFINNVGFIEYSWEF